MIGPQSVLWPMGSRRRPGLTDESSGSRRDVRAVYTMAMVNAGIWAISIIAMVFLMQDAPSAKRLFPILAGGTAVAVALIGTGRKVA